MGREASSGKYDRRKITVIFGYSKLRQQGKRWNRGFIARLHLHAAIHGAFIGKAVDHGFSIGTRSHILFIVILVRHPIAMMLVRRSPVAHSRPALFAARHRPEGQRHGADQSSDCRNGQDTPHADTTYTPRLAKKQPGGLNDNGVSFDCRRATLPFG
jgi:hypothetical protein